MPDSIIKADNISSLSGGGVGFPDGSVSNPSMKFTNDSDTGLYRIGSNTIGVASNGTRVGEINSLGLLNGNIGTDYRNLINRVNARLTRLDVPSNDSSTTSLTHVSSGVGFSYTPLNANCKLVIRFQFSYLVTFSNTLTSLNYGFIRTYIDTLSVPTIGTSPPVTSTQIGFNENIIGSSLNTSWAYVNAGMFNNTVEYINTNTNIKYFYISFRISQSTGSMSLFVGNTSYFPQYTIEEYL